MTTRTNPVVETVHDLQDMSQLKNRHMLVRSPRMAALIRLRGTLLKAIRGFMESEDFVEVTTPTITSLTGACEDFSTLFPLEYFGNKAFLTQTAQLHLEPLIHSQTLRRVYSINHSYRAEPRADHRHLTEFVLVEPEIGFGNLEILLDTEERLVSHLVASILETRREELTLLGADIAMLETIKPAFRRMTYTEAVTQLNALGIATEWGDDLDRQREIAILEWTQFPTFITHYPLELKFFNMRQNREDERIVNAADLLLPGVGEVCGGAEREEDATRLRQRLMTSQAMKHLLAAGGSADDYEWYLQLREQNSIPYAGFGMGFERLVQFITGSESCLNCVEYPRNSVHYMP
ncbi:MAG: asparagine--tRNA ligase [Chloroflexota bacterium]|nr:asparagine--tRNA ligase [Chloroflexota bacterium]